MRRSVNFRFTLDPLTLRDSEVEDVAEKIASAGGTHYVVRERTSIRHGKIKPIATVVVALVCANRTARTRNRTSV